MIDYSAYEDYFRDLATRYQKIGHSPTSNHFAVMDIDDILSAMRSDLNFETPSLILENPEGKFSYHNSALRDENFGAFLILQQCINRGDTQQKREVMDHTKKVGAQVISRMHIDKQTRFKGTKDAPRFVQMFRLEQVRYFKAGPLFSNCYGWRFEFNIGMEGAMYYDSEDWD
ncbi:hypothetical protein [Cyclobacterium marinum]|uniref:Uncharacterized protein n=1 Tax=Cyclobacterium marinum (strain ATCC 25205 / DSM 745 / LMG 13164 / NCIMB 1802) TaxID=880070 RepID=G0J367_CYCMS|nr:hypothetical protein [Cyclobacterium marinum]AEL24008.1 hypothetical protein Cycma_0226 [Cyclobacterium marinum DSM 745]